MDFEKDFFISYAHGDNDIIDKDHEGWITNFDKALKTLVYNKWGKKPKVWRDDLLRGNDDFEAEIHAQFPKLKILVSIITPRYLISKWCNDEVNAFLEAAEQTGGLSIENKTRIFKIIKTPVEPDEQPEKIRNIIGYPFYEEEGDKRIREYNSLFGPEFKVRFLRGVDDVAQDMVLLLKRLSDARLEAASKGKIYLAETSDDLTEDRNQIKRQLEDDGYTVLPNIVLPLVADKLETVVRTFMKECTLSIHIVGNEDYGIIPGKSTNQQSILEIQNDIAGELCVSAGLSKLVWIAHPSSKQADDQPKPSNNIVKNFLYKLRNVDQQYNESDLLETGIEDFKQAIKDTLNKQEEKRLAKEKEKLTTVAISNDSQLPSAEQEKGPASIYLMYDKRDKDEIKLIDDYLFDKGFEVVKPVFKGTPKELAKARELSLRDCDAALIYYGKGNDAWLRIQVSELKKKPALQYARALKTSMVYLAGPSKEEKMGFRTREVQFVVNGLKGFDETLLAAFIEKLK